jgi:predicted O-methyltransferase YrrM
MDIEIMLISKLKAYLKRLIHFFKEKQLPENQLEAISLLHCNTSNLGKITSEELTQWFNDQELDNLWNLVKQDIESLKLPEMTGCVNPGDQRALFYLISALKPQKVLEIGTHIGCSTIHIALALKNLSSHSLVTVDIRDVNDPIQQPWLEFNASASPSDLIQKLGCQEFTQFKISPSIEFLDNDQQRFDLIFLDGSHEAEIVYQEVPRALQKLSKSGFIILHDYFPDGKSIWENQQPITGPYLAIKRLQKEGATFNVIPLGKLPWPTKLGTNITSLALLTSKS